MREAEDLYRQILDIDPRQPDALHLLGLVAFQTGNCHAAVDLITQAIAIKNTDAAYHEHLALSLVGVGRGVEAERAAMQAMALNPDQSETFNNLGNLLQEMGRMDEALICRQKAYELTPDNHLYSYNYAITLERFGRLEEAEAFHYQALKLDPNFPEGLNGLGELHRKAGRVDEAVACYQRALALRADFVEALNNLGLAYSSRGQLFEATAILQRCLALRPANDAALSNLGNIYQMQGRAEEAADIFRRAVEVNPGQAVAHSNLIFAMIHMHDATGETLLRQCGEWDRAQSMRTPIIQHSFANDRDPDRRLRVGFVSADFKDHAVSYFLLPLFRAFDRSRVELVCYNEVRNEDVVTGWFRDSVDCWRDSKGIHDQGLTEMCRADAIDILVDCGGHSGGNRLTAFKRRPAPIQITTPLGHGGTTGVREMDYFIGDPFLTPAGSDSQFSETVIRLDKVFAPFEPKDFWPEPVASVPEQPLFGCFGDPARISRQTLLLWRRLLDAVPGARILFKHKAYGSDAMAEHWAVRFAPIADRAIFEGLPGGWVGNMDVYGRVRVMLDTFPAAGATSSLIPLWMGVPVLSRVGTHTLQRFGAPILHNLGLADLAAESDDAFVSAGSALIADDTRLARLRASLRPTLRDSALCDAQGAARQWEAAFRHVWHAWLAEAGR
ncbi:hypothetical protein A6A04_12125 [Paramagnetospirillum marisnigri]|uniref:protein O-GlcNAc transferase n=1 Tax=Paramagnetospirillum marisnigri TaxID=1285242 RepID=A0A178MVV0_9PROT|nr:hypothetical protein A6A04_12125 [Paramagnetospirillum marisnigri]